MTAPDTAPHSLELVAARDTLARVLTEALGEARGRERERIVERFDHALAALERAASDLAATELDTRADAWRRAQEVVREVAALLEASRLDALRALAPRVSAVEAGMRDVQGDTRFDAQRRDPRPPHTFKASRGVPALHRLPPRAAARKLRAPRRAAPSLDGLGGLIAGMQRSLFGMAGRLLRDGDAALDELDGMLSGLAPDDEPEQAGVIVPLRAPAVTEDTVGRRGQEAMLRRVARSVMEDIGAAGMLRMPRDDDPISPQARRFEARALAGLDALAALAADGRVTIDITSEVVKWASDGSVGDGFRPFVRALVLSCVDGDAAEAAVLALRTSPPGTWAMQADALRLGSSPRVDGALSRALAGESDAALLPHLLGVLEARRTLSLSDVLPFLHHDDAAVRKSAAAGIAVAASPSEAERALRDLLEREVDDDVIAGAIESLTLADRSVGRDELRRRLDEDADRDGLLAHSARIRLLEQLAIVGDASDVERLTRGIARHPRDAGAVGWHGSALLVGPLCDCLESRDPRAAIGAARSLHRITGAALADPDDPETRRDPDPYRPVLSAARWRAWWDAQGDDFRSDRRYRFGSEFHLQTTIDEIMGLALSGSVLRLALYELSVATGRVLPDHRMWLTAIVSAVEALRAEIAALPPGAWLPARSPLRNA